MASYETVETSMDIRIAITNTNPLPRIPDRIPEMGPLRGQTAEVVAHLRGRFGPHMHVLYPSPKP